MIPADFDYALPRDRIAQRPARPRDASRLLLLRREQPGGRTADLPVAHAGFRDLPAHLRAGDLLVVNDARVLPARLRGRKRATGGGVEILLLGPAGAGRWRALARGLRRAPLGTKLLFPSEPGPDPAPASALEAELAGREADGAFVLTFSGPAAADPARLGEMPIPPYIRAGRADARDRDDYQTCFAEIPGAVAAPTAGLHFTPGLIGRLREGGVLIERITLQVGWGTFAPLDQARIDAGRLHPESFAVGERTARAVNDARAEGRRVIAVGTTVVRVLETASDASGRLEPRRGTTELFIRPGHRFRCVDALITNFHLPRSSLLMLVCAFAGRERVLAAYREAVERRYRFYSYGDAMLIH